MKLVLIHLKVVFFNIWEQIKVSFCYYKNGYFLITDLLFHCLYLFKNPYRICKKQGYLYGETPITVMDTIAKECRILSKDVVYDLGCGRARNLFWLSHFVGCHTHGIDICFDFIKLSKFLNKVIKLEKVSFSQGNFMDMDWNEATFIYLYGTLTDEATIKLIDKLYNTDAKIITVSFSLNEYCNHQFKIEKKFCVRFPWGKANVYLQQKIKSEKEIE